MEQIWWERVPHAREFIEKIVESLLSRKSVLLQHTETLPWQKYFITAVQQTVKQRDSLKMFESVDGVDDPGEYLLDRFCESDKRAQYRPSKSYACFLAESDDIILHERYIWVEIGSAEQLDRWAAFVSEYIKCRSARKPVAVFVLDWQGIQLGKRWKGINNCSFDGYIGEYDQIVFSMLASSSVQEEVFLKNYLAELAVNVIGNDVELYAECFKHYKAFMFDPYQVIMECQKQAYRSDGTEFQYTRSLSDVKHLIWQTQIRTVYPMLEEFREDFVERHREAIEAQLPITTSYDEVYSDPGDVELGMLIYMAGTDRLMLSTKEYDRLLTFKNARNRLSHLGILTLDEILHLLEWFHDRRM